MVFFDSRFQQVISEKGEQKERLTASSDAGNYFDQTVSFAFNKFAEVIISFNFHL
jgi:hypothetical protein